MEQLLAASAFFVARTSAVLTNRLVPAYRPCSLLVSASRSTKRAGDLVLTVPTVYNKVDRFLCCLFYVASPMHEPLAVALPARARCLQVVRKSTEKMQEVHEAACDSATRARQRTLTMVHDTYLASPAPPLVAAASGARLPAHTSCMSSRGSARIKFETWLEKRSRE